MEVWTTHRSSDTYRKFTMTHYVHIVGDTASHRELMDLLMNGLGPDIRFIAASEPAPAIARFSALPDDVLWQRYEPHDVSHLTAGGDLILDIRDLFAQQGFWNGSLLRRWANHHGLSMGEWNNQDAMRAMLNATLLPAIREHDSALAAAFEAFREDDAAVPDLPSLRVIVNGVALTRYLVAHFDGPFGCEDELEAAVEFRRRTRHPADDVQDVVF